MACNLLTVGVTSVKFLVNHDQALNATGLILMETLAETCDLSLPIVNLAVLLTCHASFRRHIRHLLPIRRLRLLFSSAIKQAQRPH